MSDRIFYCVGCGTVHPKNNFYKSSLSDHANGRLFYCKEYMKEKCYNKSNEIDKEQFAKMLRQLNIAFLPDLLDSSIVSGKDIIGDYFSKYNGLKQYRGMTWDDGISMEKILDEDVPVEDEEQNSASLDDFVVTAKIKSRWGSTYSKKEIMDHERFYNDMHKMHTIVTPQHEKALIMICKLQQKMEKLLDEGDMSGFQAHHKEYQTLLKTSGLRPVDNQGLDEATGMKSFSQIFEEVERDGFIRPKKTKANIDIVDRTIQYILNYTLKLLNQNVLTEPPVDTPKEGEQDEYE